MAGGVKTVDARCFTLSTHNMSAVPCCSLLQSNRLDIDVSFSTAGGVEIEENWDKVKTITIPTAESITGAGSSGAEDQPLLSSNTDYLQRCTLGEERMLCQWQLQACLLRHSCAPCSAYATAALCDTLCKCVTSACAAALLLPPSPRCLATCTQCSWRICTP
jgi:hypothetical protein